MKNIIAIILIIVGVSNTYSQVPELTLGTNTYQIVAGSELDTTLRTYDEGYNAGVAATGGTNGLVSMNFVSGREPSMSIYQNGNTYELQFSYEVNVTGSGAGADKRYSANGTTAAFVYIEFLHTVPGTGSSAGQWQDPDYRLALEYSYRFGDPQFGQVIANNTAGSRLEIEDFHTLFINENTRVTHARITIQHQTGVRLNRIIEITLPE